MRILCFGDSITYGAWDTEGGWADRLKRRTHADVVASQGESRQQVFNLGVGGNSTTDLLARLSPEIEARKSARWPLTLVFMIGTNDSRLVGEDRVEQTSIEQFKTNIEEIIDISRQYDARIIFLGLLPVGQPMINFKDYVYENERIVRYDAVIRQIAEQSNVAYIPLYDEFEARGAEGLLFIDQLHPNDAGHELLASIVSEHIKTQA